MRIESHRSRSRALPGRYLASKTITYRGSCSEIALRYTLGMTTMAEVEKLAFDLPDSERAILAAHLLRSLPSVLHDEDEGVAEALRRDAELDANPEAGITIEQLDQRIRDR